MGKISIIVPCYNEEAALPIYYREMSKVMDQMKDVEFEILFVDDGSTDQTLQQMKILNDQDERCQYFSFSRKMQQEIMLRSWMWIFRIRRHFFRKCTKFYRQEIMTA